MNGRQRAALDEVEFMARQMISDLWLLAASLDAVLAEVAAARGEGGGPGRERAGARTVISIRRGGGNR